MSEDSEPISQPSNAGDTSPFSYHPAWGFGGVLFGVLILLGVAAYERVTLRDTPGTRIIYSVEGDVPWAGTLPIIVGCIPMSNFPSIDTFVTNAIENALPSRVEEIEANFEALGMRDTEAFMVIDLEVDDFSELIESGRVPARGMHEVLAGVHARLDTFTLNGEEYRVVGRLRRSAVGLHFAYLLPRDLESEDEIGALPGATRGWLDLDAGSTPEEVTVLEEGGEKMSVIRHRIPTESTVTLGAMTGLLMVAFFGMLAHLSVFRILLSRRCGPLRPALRVFLQYPKMVLVMHVLLYGSFFGTMLLAYANPILQMWVYNLIQTAFEEGSIAYVKEAYASGNVFRAAWATYVNNFLIQTVLLTVGISLVMPMIGVLKTTLSFVVVGLGMVPAWVGDTGMYSFHSITMTLELEAYIFACVCVVYFWYCFGVGLLRKRFVERMNDGFRVLGSGTLLAGIMLAIAGFYEAVTLILARG